MPIYLEEGISELMEGYGRSDKGPKLQTSRLRAIGRQVVRGKQVLPKQNGVGRRSVYGNNGRHTMLVIRWRCITTAKGRIEGLLNGSDDGALLLADFNEFISSTGAWKRDRDLTESTDWQP